MQINDILNFTDTATERFRQLAKKGKIVHLAVQGGGCYGFSYKFNTIDNDEIKAEDYSLEQSGENIFILDKESVDILKGSTVDYITDGFAQYFKLNNPQAGSNCGCGSSFDLKD